MTLEKMCLERRCAKVLFVESGEEGTLPFSGNETVGCAKKQLSYNLAMQQKLHAEEPKPQADIEPFVARKYRRLCVNGERVNDAISVAAAVAEACADGGGGVIDAFQEQQGGGRRQGARKKAPCTRAASPNPAAQQARAECETGAGPSTSPRSPLPIAEFTTDDKEDGGEGGDADATNQQLPVRPCRWQDLRQTARRMADRAAMPTRQTSSSPANGGKKACEDGRQRNAADGPQMLGDKNRAEPVTEPSSSSAPALAAAVGEVVPESKVLRKMVRKVYRLEAALDTANKRLRMQGCDSVSVSESDSEEETVRGCKTALSFARNAATLIPQPRD